MNIAISIPTYRPHLVHNIAFLKSLVRYHAHREIPEIHFTTSDEGERDELRRFVGTLPPALAGRVHVESLGPRLAAAFDKSLAEDLDGGFAYGSIGFVTYKKFLGLEALFAKGFERAVIIDSEVIQFREGDLNETLRREVERDEYRVSQASYRDPWATKVQHDSLRTVVRSYDTGATFARSYGWFDNLCLFERDGFRRFIADLSGATGDGAVLAAVRRFRGFGFDWIAYRAWQNLVEQRPLRLVDLDGMLRKVGVEPRPKPQTENLFLYFDGDVAHDAAIARALDPPWVPFTRNANYIEALKRGTDESCCLMFHADRRHPGAAALPNLPQRMVRFVLSGMRSLAKRLKAWEA